MVEIVRDSRERAEKVIFTMVEFTKDVDWVRGAESWVDAAILENDVDSGMGDKEVGEAAKMGSI